MDKNALRHKRNKSLIQFLWIINILDYLFYIYYEQDYKILWPPVGLILCLAVTVLYLTKMRSEYLMYLLLFSIFGYTFYLNMIYPNLINYLFLYSGIIVSSFYLSTGLLVFSSAASFLLMTIVYFINKNYTFDYRGYEDFPYFILFGIFISTLLFLLLRFTNNLWNKAAENEQRTKKDLQSTKSYFESLFTYSRDAICILDRQGNFLEVNEAFQKLYSYSFKGQKQMAFSDFFTANDEIVLWDIIDKVKFGESIGSLELRRGSSQHSNAILGEATVSPIYSSHDELIAIAVIIRDITEKRLMEEYMRNSEKLKVTGEIAAGVAHEIRNPLTVIGGFIQMLREEDGPNRHYYSIIHSEINRMNDIISEFLILAKPQIYTLKIQNIKELAEEVVLLFQSESNFKNVDVQLTAAPEYLPILCEGNQLKQVFINLLKNSFEALPDGGKIHIEIGKDEHATEIIIEDNGTGIPEHVLSNIGKPFYTTKEDGTGLGFMITERIIEMHKGTLQIESEVGKGTRVQIILPGFDK
ncbi:ATP-binding protein [Peribacillus deserti]|uniref:histidine kinase n=1 Tax=Peribacillus deserti TaxID=673318 RepID=A0A2N5M3K5_9BACI|nr:ATP-binding protein [Peribacillus deserti]PLT28944.1 hypothetical protein CUU66_15750 [Peribacillus deserti]